jgi:hypothetical protein
MLASGTSRWIIPRTTEHVETNLWLAGCFGARAALDDRRVEVEGLALS